MTLDDWATCPTPAPLLPDAACSCVYDADDVAIIFPAEVTCPTPALVVPVAGCSCVYVPDDDIIFPAEVTTAILTYGEVPSPCGK